MKKIDKQLHNTPTKGPSHLVDIIEPMQAKYNKYWLKMKDFAAINKVFEPRRKLERLEFTLQGQTADPNDPAATSLIDIESNLAAWFKEVVSSKNRSTSTPSTGKSPDPKKSQTPLKDNKDMCYKKYLESKKATHMVSTTAELDLYLQEPPVISDSQTFSVLSWWSANKG
ncbi:hypothetical protein MJO28_016222 [Puccinia striiformis f. sp. tritici]|uniref:Uncharacterized protein n=1 Tax=Puccinia striiformis f. sp. tritici TaxID=168172 RepID=A0ACC0DNI6_9BASI|nr:hypothetical protein MJO28_016222 [Puccinia striiformis f. sp. tritici]